MGPGTPDVSFARGWMELKSVEHWPKREATPLRLPHFTPGQRVWLVQHCAAGGWAFLLIKVARDWMLFDGIWAARYLGEITREEMLENTLWHSEGLDKEGLIECLKRICFPEKSST